MTPGSIKLKAIHRSFLIYLGMEMLSLFGLHLTKVKRRKTSVCLPKAVFPRNTGSVPNFLYPLFHGLIFIFQVHIVTSNRMSRNNHFSLKAGNERPRWKVGTTVASEWVLDLRVMLAPGAFYLFIALAIMPDFYLTSWTHC